MTGRTSLMAQSEKDSYVSIADREGYYPFIDGLRGIAILMVVAVHTGQALGMHETRDFLIPYVSRLIDCGSRGVQLFFILSAFTLFSSSFRRFQKDKLPRLCFYIRRAFRILPLWWLANVVFGTTGSRRILKILSSSLFAFGFVRYDIANDIVPGGWSLFVEETFYLFLPLIFYRLTSLKRSIYFLLLLFVVSISWRIVARLGHLPESNGFAVAFPLNQWCCFGFGIVIFHLLKTPAWLAYAKRRDLMAVLDVASIVLLLWLVTALQFYIATAALAFFVVMSSSETTLSGRFTRNRLLKRFGTYCYSIYLLHFLIVAACGPFLALIRDLRFELRFFLGFVVVAACCLVCGHISFYFFEKPSVDLGKRVIRRIQLKAARPRVVADLTA